MMRAESDTYDPLAKALHWLIAALMAVQYLIAWFMPHIGRRTPNEGLVNLHLSVGALILLVVVVRLAWRLSRGAPPPAADIAPWQRTVAGITHWLLYAFLVVQPVLGWMNAGARGFAVSLFHLVPLPALVDKGSPLGGAVGDVHVWIGWGALALIGMHVAAALYHRFVLRDSVLGRMLPAGS